VLAFATDALAFLRRHNHVGIDGSDKAEVDGAETRELEQTQCGLPVASFKCLLENVEGARYEAPGMVEGTLPDFLASCVQCCPEVSVAASPPPDAVEASHFSASAISIAAPCGEEVNGAALLRVQQKARALVESGLVDRPPVRLQPLPSDAPTAAITTWCAIESLLVARRVLDEEPGTPLPLVAPFLVRWSRGIVEGATEATLRAGKRWLEDARVLERAGTAPGSFGKRTQLWRVAEVGFAGDERGAGWSRH
jgi:hypothetical protein